MLKEKPFYLIIAFAILSNALSGKYVSDIKDCSPLSPRSPPKSIHDLRPDDIKVIGALGDSIAAGYAARDADISKLVLVKEFRGLSFIIGGEKGASTLPNFLKHYQSNLTGYSDGVHAPEYCFFEFCFAKHIPNIDNLNAAQSSAGALHLDKQLTYLIDRMLSMKNIDFENDWKIISIHIGHNDLCQLCVPHNTPQATPLQYEYYLTTALERIRSSIPRVMVNLIDTFDVSQTVRASKISDHCKGLGSVSSEVECPCARLGEFGERIMSKTLSEYNRINEKLSDKYQAMKSDTFALIHQHADVDISTCPKYFFSNLDCFHTSAVGHKYFSALLWNFLFNPSKDRPRISRYRSDIPIYCPTNADRLITH